MTIRTLNWCTPDKLDCEASIPVTAYLCVPASIVTPTPSGADGIIEATITGVRASTCADPCGLCKWVYTITYDDAQLVAGYLLVASSIKEVICDGCLIELITSLVPTAEICLGNSDTLSLSFNDDGCLEGEVNISADAENCLEARADGLYSPCAEGGAGWELLGNAGTVDGTNFIGTTDNVAHDVRVNDLRARRTEPDTTARIVDGHPDNDVNASTGGAILSGGKTSPDHNELVAGSNFSVIGGGSDNEVAGIYCGILVGNGNVITGPDQNSAIITGTSCTIDNTGNVNFDPFTGSNVIAGGFFNEINTTDYNFIGCGSDNTIDGQLADPTSTRGWHVITGGQQNTIEATATDGQSRHNVIGGGSTNRVRNNGYSTVSGGFSNEILNTASSVILNVGNTISGGDNNTLTGCNTSTIGGGYNSSITNQNRSVISGGFSNSASGTLVTVPQAHACCVIVGGEANKILDGLGTTHLGGGGLQLGAYSIGYQNPSTRTRVSGIINPTTQVDLSGTTGIAVFSDTDFWIGNTDSIARKLKLFEPQNSLTYTGANFTSLKAQAQAANIEYIMPAAAGSVNDLLSISGISGTDVTLSWAAPSAGGAEDGWTAISEAMTYVSASSFSIATDVTAKYNKGDKLKLTNTTLKYFVIIDIAFAGVTTITVSGGSDYALASAAITGYFSKQATPNGYPQWFNWLPVCTDFSVQPSNSRYRFYTVGRACYLVVSQDTAGTSNGTAFTIPLPFAAASTAAGSVVRIPYAEDNGSSITNPAYAIINTSGSVINLFTTNLGGPWQNTGGKRAYLQMSFEF